MSVINQMLKDLDNRQSPSKDAVTSSTTTIANNGNTFKYVMIVLLIGLILVLAYVGYGLQHQKSSQVSALNSAVTKPTNDSALMTDALQTVEPIENKNTVIEQDDKTTAKDREKAELNVKATNEINNEIENVVPAAKGASASDKLVSKPAKVLDDKLQDDVGEIELAPKASLSITPSKLTTDELVAKKWKQAQLALGEEKPIEAEKHFQDILLLKPSHHDARQQLAALWFGQGDLTAADNVLAQGNSLFPDKWSFRLMRAKIYRKQGDFNTALSTLLQSASVIDVEYQMAIIDLARTLKKYTVVQDAYQVLLAVSASNGRWWLGLAIAFDSDGKYTEATAAYKQALSLADLPSSSRQFARNRLAELGE